MEATIRPGKTYTDTPGEETRMLPAGRFTAQHATTAPMPGGHPNSGRITSNPSCFSGYLMRSEIAAFAIRKKWSEIILMLSIIRRQSTRDNVREGRQGAI